MHAEDRVGFMVAVAEREADFSWCRRNSRRARGGISSDLSAATLSVPFTHHFLLLHAGISFLFLLAIFEAYYLFLLFLT